MREGQGPKLAPGVAARVMQARVMQARVMQARVMKEQGQASPAGKLARI